MKLHYFVQFESEGFPVAVTVNDVPLWNAIAGTQSKGGRTVNMWVRPGGNRARLTPVPADAARGVASLEVVTQEGEDKESRRVIARLAWPPPDGVPPRLADVDLPFAADPAPPAALWGQAQPIVLDPASQDAILAAVGELHAALAARDLDRVMAQLQVSIADVGRSVYVAPETALANQREILADMMAGTWAPEPWDPARAEIALVEDGLLASVTVDGKPALAVSLGDGRYVRPVYVARLGGAFTIAR